MAVMDWVGGRVFKLVHGNNLVYNTCWEDPRLDRQALDIRPTDRVLVITSAGCNALDYVLAGARHVFAVDMNPRQNALLDLKLAAIRHLEFPQFFAMFGQGRLPGVRKVYEQQLRRSLSTWSRDYWDKWIKFFDNKRRSFYFRGTSGAFARLVNAYADHVVRIRPTIDALLNAPTLDHQRAIFDDCVRERFWSRSLRFAMNRDTTLSMVGVPRAQRRQIETQYEGGIVKFVQDSVDAVFTQLPMRDNYFWRVYMTGEYTRECCPEYLVEKNFLRLKEELLGRISIHTDSVQGFLDKHPGQISRFVLLDHMDWLSDRFFPLLELEWQAILNRASPDARLIWRSGGLKTDYLERVRVDRQGRLHRLPDLLTYNERLASELHPLDRVHTYGSFYIADLAA